MWLQQTKTTQDWPSCREVSPDWKISQACWKMQGVLKVFLLVIELDHISVVPLRLWHLSWVLRALLHCSVETAMVPRSATVPHAPDTCCYQVQRG